MFRSLTAHAIAVIAILACASPAPAASAAASPTPDVRVIRVTGVIDPFLAGYVVRSLRDADAAHAALCVLAIDTPGGLDPAMRDIVEAVLATRTPVVAYVTPDGARAASAGVFIAFAAPLLAMAPTTAIGAAHPVDLHGTPASDKITNDAASYLRGLAERRHRPVEWAESAVRASASLSAQDAVTRGVADLIARDLPDLLARVEGRTIDTAAGSVRIEGTAHAPVHAVEMRAGEKLLHAIAHPNVAYVLFLLGIYGLLFEFANPGINFAGIAGAVCLVLALVAFQALDASTGGLALLLLAGVLLIFDVTAPSHGVLTTGALLALAAGSLLLFRPGTAAVRLSPWLIAIAVGATAAFALFALRAGVRAHKRPVALDPRGVVGQIGRAVTDLSPDGVVSAGAERWSAVAEAPVAKGAAVEVIAVRGLTLHVRAAGAEKEDRT